MARMHKIHRVAWLFFPLSLFVFGAAAGRAQSQAPIEAVVAVDMFSAANQGNMEILQMLLSYAHGAINNTNEIGDTPLHCAVKGAHLEAVKYLLDNGADVNAINAKGNTPLDCAPVDVQFSNMNTAQTQESPIASLLKSRGAKYHHQLEPPSAPAPQPAPADETSSSWKISSAKLQDVAPAGGGQATVTLFAANKKPRYLYLQLESPPESAPSGLEDFAIRTGDGQFVGGGPVVVKNTPTGITLVFHSETGWDSGAEYFLHGLGQRQSFIPD